MHALVTGGGGFLGLYIVEQLLARGDTVRVFCRGEYPRLRELGVEYHRGDVRDAEAVSTAVNGVETVFHTAAVPGIWGPWKLFYSINTQGTEHVIDACRRHGVPKLVYTSSPSVVFDGTSHDNADESLPYPAKYACHYPHTKALAEQAALAANDGKSFATCALRPHLIWGPRDNHLVPRLIARAKSGRLRRVGDGENRVSMSYVENAAASHLRAADALSFTSPVAGQAYFINEPQPVKLWEWVDELLSDADLPPLEKTISAKAAARLGGVIETAYRLCRIKREPPMTRFLAAQLSSSHCYDTTKAQRDFDSGPRVSVEEGMARLRRDMQERAR